MTSVINKKIPILYSFRRCPFAIRARSAIYFSNIKVELREVLLRDKPPEMLDISSKGTVPVLYIDNNHIIDESFDIMIWGIEYAQLDLLKKESQKQFNMIKTNDNDFKYWLDRYKYFNRFPELTINDYQNKCKDFLITYDKILTDNISNSKVFISDS